MRRRRSLLPLRVQGAATVVGQLVKRLAPGSTVASTHNAAPPPALAVAEALDSVGTVLARTISRGPSPYDLTAELLAWGAVRAACGRMGGPGVLGPVQALSSLEQAAADIGLQRALSIESPLGPDLSEHGVMAEVKKGDKVAGRTRFAANGASDSSSDRRTRGGRRGAARAAARCARAVRGGRVAPTVRSRVGGGTSPPSSSNAARTRRTLADLKGGALKAGQLAVHGRDAVSQDPEETWRQTLTGLQEQGTPVPFATLEPVLSEASTRWCNRFRDLDLQPAAAASIGQVHRGTWWDGRDVAVKVQYPGIREAIGADLRTVSAMSRLAAIVARPSPCRC